MCHPCAETSAGCQCRGERGEESLPLVIYDLTARYTIIQRYSCANAPMYFMRKLTRLRDIVLSRLKSKLRHCIVGMHQLGDLHVRGLNSKEERVDAFQGRHSCLHPGEAFSCSLTTSCWAYSEKRSSVMSFSLDFSM